jgi:hypothetical protein
MPATAGPKLWTMAAGDMLMTNFLNSAKCKWLLPIATQQKIHVKHSGSNGNMRAFSSRNAGVGDEPRSTVPAVKVEGS